MIADYLENQFASHDLCDNNHERQVETTVQALLSYVDDNPLGKVGPCDIKLANILKLRKACGFDGIPNKCLRHLPRRQLVHLINLVDHCLWLSHFAKVITLPKPGKDHKFPQNLCKQVWFLCMSQNDTSMY
jgi:hypothetical protein